MILYFSRSGRAEYDEDEAIYDACAHAVDDDGPGDAEHLHGGAGDKPLGLELQRRGDDGVCKARDGNERARPGVPGEVVVNAKTRQHRADEHQRDRARRRGVALV